MNLPVYYMPRSWLIIRNLGTSKARHWDLQLMGFANHSITRLPHCIGFSVLLTEAKFFPGGSVRLIDEAGKLLHGSSPTMDNMCWHLSSGLTNPQLMMILVGCRLWLIQCCYILLLIFSGWWFGCHFWNVPTKIGNLTIPIDEVHLFQRGSSQPPTSFVVGLCYHPYYLCNLISYRVASLVLHGFAKLFFDLQAMATCRNGLFGPARFWMFLMFVASNVKIDENSVVS